MIGVLVKVILELLVSISPLCDTKLPPSSMLLEELRVKETVNVTVLRIIDTIEPSTRAKLPASVNVH